MTDSYDRDTRTIRPGAAAPAAPADTPPPAPAAAEGLVAELKPYFPRMAVGAALMLFADLWWSGRHHRKERRRERKRRRRGRR